MKIISLESSNFKRLRAVQITPEGNVVTLAGENGAGKSSVLDSIYAALGGKDASPGVPIRQGEQKATIKLDLGEIIVTRRFDGDKTDVVVSAASGARFPSPQKMLDGLIGHISFDPLSFMREKPKDQLEMLRKLVKLDVDIDALAGQNQDDFEKRTEVNREVKSLQARADAIVLPADCPTEHRDTQEILDRLTSASAHNMDVASRRAARAAATEEIAGAHDKIEAVKKRCDATKEQLDFTTKVVLDDIDAQIATLQRRREEAVASALLAGAQIVESQDAATAEIQKRTDDLKAKLANAGPLPESIDVDAVRAELTSAEDHNALVMQWSAKAVLRIQADQKKAESDRLTAAMAERDRQREEAMKTADFPIDGLAFGEDEVLFGSLPLSQASTAEQIRISMAIATDLNPKLRVICIREASFLDAAGLKIVAEMAEASDMQVWLEDNRSTDPAAIIIEDGAVKGQVIKQTEGRSLPAQGHTIDYSDGKPNTDKGGVNRGPSQVTERPDAPSPMRPAPTKLL